MNYTISSLKLLALALLVLMQWQSVIGLEWGCREEERSALLQINANLSFPIYSSDGKWEGRECCRWERVTCDSTTGHVTELDLGLPPGDLWPESPGFLLNATMFLPLRQLASLSLSGHGISDCMDGPGFESWSNLTKLEILDLSSNVLPKSVISSLAKVSSLRELYLNFNSMGGNVPVKELSALNLEVISLYGCKFSGSFPDLGHWYSLQALSLGDNDLSGTLTSQGLCRLKNLKELDLSSNNFDGNLPSCMGNLSSLKLVDLSYNQFQVNFPSSIFERLMSLRYLSLSRNQLEGTLSLRTFLNHSNLEVLRLSTTILNFRIEDGNLPFQIQDLELANCILDVEPTFLYSLHKLRVLDLSNTRSKGPGSVVWLLLENNPNLIALILHKNLFTGPLQLPSLTHEKLLILGISYNHLGGELPANITTKLPNLSYLNLSNNYFQGPLPLMSTKNIQVLDLSFNNLTDDIMNSFLRIVPPIPSFFDLSNNNFYGSLTNNLNFTQDSTLLLSDNNISGEIPFSICNISFEWMDMSNNKLNGVLPDCIGRAELWALKLSGNHLEGSLPLEMCVVTGLWLLDLSHNKFSGSIPPCSNYSTLEILDLSQNNLTGNFPITWLNIPSIYAINIEKNHLSGELPIDTRNLKMLQASENQFKGPIPELCQFNYLHILDLSHNNLSGQIPSCIFHMVLPDTYLPYLPALRHYLEVGEMNYIDANLHYYIGVGELNFRDANFSLHVQYNLSWDNEESMNFGLEFMSKGRLDFYWKNILQLEYLIDLSSNKLVGNIPDAIGKINWLVTLNLSNNHLSDTIPTSISNLYQLESMDLSHNSLTGEIPRELTKLTSLEFFSVACNNLSGSTLGVEEQFISFDYRSYEGNPNLCGPPLSKSCVPIDTTHPSLIEMSDDRTYDTNFLIFFGSFSLFFVISFWSFMAVLYFKRNWRYALYTMVDLYGDIVYVKVVLLLRKIGVARIQRGN